MTDKKYQCGECKKYFDGNEIAGNNGLCDDCFDREMMRINVYEQDLQDIQKAMELIFAGAEMVISEPKLFLDIDPDKIGLVVSIMYNICRQAYEEHTGLIYKFEYERKQEAVVIDGGGSKPSQK